MCGRLQDLKQTCGIGDWASFVLPANFGRLVRGKRRHNLFVETGKEGGMNKRMLY